MFLFEDENNDKTMIIKYTVEHDMDIDTYSLWLLNAEDEEVYYEEFLTYEEIYKYLGQLRFNYLERFNNN